MPTGQTGWLDRPSATLESNVTLCFKNQCIPLLISISLGRLARSNLFGPARDVFVFYTFLIKFVVVLDGKAMSVLTGMGGSSATCTYHAVLNCVHIKNLGSVSRQQ